MNIDVIMADPVLTAMFFKICIFFSVKCSYLYFYLLKYSITLNRAIFYYNCECNSGFLVTNLRKKHEFKIRTPNSRYWFNN